MFVIRKNVRVYMHSNVKQIAFMALAVMSTWYVNMMTFYVHHYEFLKYLERKPTRKNS